MARGGGAERPRAQASSKAGLQNYPHFFKIPFESANYIFGKLSTHDNCSPLSSRHVFNSSTWRGCVFAFVVIVITFSYYLFMSTMLPNASSVFELAVVAAVYVMIYV
jgi:hypothetical protein